ncbi:ACT domain-containing protein [Methanococcus sp. CF]
MENVVITVVGVDKPGIVAAVTKILAEHSANIVDIRQTIMEDLFTMIMLVDISKISSDFSELNVALEKLGSEIGVKINVQHENIFKYMHRI